MRMILIRHGDPDYVRDTLTEKGWREAELLSRRAKNWKIDDVYTSPLGRAKDTASLCLKAWNKSATVLPWAEEFVLPAKDERGWDVIPWDFLPADWTENEENFRGTEWLKLIPAAREKYEILCSSLDSLLSRYGYERAGKLYRVRAHSEKIIVIFCHFGVSMMMLSHLLNLPAEALLHGIYLPPTSLTVLNSEERSGEEAYFRAERLGDCAHLIAGGEPISPSGYFAPVMNEPPL